MHLSTRGNNKILRTPLPPIKSSEEILPHLTRRTPAQLRTNKSHFLNYTYTKSTLNHIHHQITPLQHSHTQYLFNCNPHMHHVVTPGFVDRSLQSDSTACQMDGDAG